MRCASCSTRNADYALVCIQCGLPLAPGEQHTVATAPRAQRVTPGVIGAIVLVSLVPLLIMLASFALPAYRSFSIRSQVAEGYALAKAYEDEVVRAWQLANRDFNDVTTETLRSDLARDGTYVESIDVISGAIVVRFGRSASDELQGRTLTIVPALDPRRRVVAWQCGRGAAREGFVAIFDEPGRLTDIPNDYLADDCRGY